MSTKAKRYTWRTITIGVIIVLIFLLLGSPDGALQMAHYFVGALVGAWLWEIEKAAP